MIKRWAGVRLGVFLMIGALLALPASAQKADDGIYRQLNLFGDVLERSLADYVEELKDPE